MCGIVGFIDFKKTSSEKILSEMIKTMHHRGPDNQGTELYDNDGFQIGFAQARLSIIDLTNAGHQPMHYKNLSIVFNGEIYNYKEVREKLIKLGHTFVTSSDTEVIIHAYEEWSYECVHEFIGMFAFVIWNKELNKIVIFRDRAGVKPMHYCWNGDLFLFGSELKALIQHPRFNKEINTNALALYFKHGYIPAPYCIYKDTQKLESGKYLTIDLNNKSIELKTYWEVSSFYKKERLKISYDEAKEKLHKLLISACNYRMIADVPVGVFLSGGYDSTAITAILQKDRKDKLKTFTIGFEEGNNEAPYARETANYLGTDHTEYICTTKEAQNIIPNLPLFFDEPFGDSSAIPTTLVSILAKKDVKVALSADAGDEIFAGYSTYQSLINYNNKLNKIPNYLKPTLRSTLKIVSSCISYKKFELNHKLDCISNSLNKNNLQQTATLFGLMSQLPENLIKQVFNSNISINTLQTHYNIDANNFHEELDSVMSADYNMYLQNDILTKVDRATMSVSMEGREPLIDHRIVEFVAQLPFDYKFKNGISKRILKDIVHEYIPKQMMDRPKTGFSLPIYKWLKGDLNYLMLEYMSSESLAMSGLLNVSFILEQTEKFKKDKFHYSPLIWYILMFQMWYKKWI